MTDHLSHWLAKLIHQLHKRGRSRTRSRSRRTCLGVEALEDRTVPTVFNVNSLADLSLSPGVNNATGAIMGTHTVTLRSAIEAANATPGANTIRLTRSGTYKITIPPASPDDSPTTENNTTGDFNTAIGYGTFNFGNHTGNGDTAVGYTALIDNTTGNNNTALGFQSGGSVSTASNVICIGANVSGANVSNSCYIGSIWMQTGGSQAVYVNSAGKLGAQVSSRRFKDEIKPMEKTSEVIYLFRPVSFRYKPEIEPTCPLGFGLIAEDVEKINPDLVMCDKEGKPYSVRYDQVNAMLLNEFLKEHRKVEQLEKQVEKLTAGLQKVSTQLELNKPAPQTVLNDR